MTARTGLHPFFSLSGNPMLGLIAGFAIWSSAFVVLYGFAGLACEYGWQRVPFGPLSLSRAIMLGIFAVHLAALAWLLSRQLRSLRDTARPDTVRFLNRAGTALTVTAIAATLWIGMALAVPSQCVT
jgi:hypothetical protein